MIFRMKCKYGSSCYRKRPEHFIEYGHPPDHPITNMFAKKRKIEDEERTESTSKKSKETSNEQTVANAEHVRQNRFGLFVTEVRGIQTNIPKMSLKSLLSSHGALESQIHFNFMIDVQYFIKSRPKDDTSRVMFITGDGLGQLPKGYFQIGWFQS